MRYQNKELSSRIKNVVFFLNYQVFTAAYFLHHLQLIILNILQSHIFVVWCIIIYTPTAFLRCNRLIIKVVYKNGGKLR
jgi:hypothetical protein